MQNNKNVLMKLFFLWLKFEVKLLLAVCIESFSQSSLSLDIGGIVSLFCRPSLCSRRVKKFYSRKI